MLADGVDWLTPQNISAIIALLGFAAVVVVAVLNYIGKGEEAKKVAELSGKLKANETKLMKSVDVAKGIIKGVEGFRNNSDDEAKAAVAAEIKKATKEMGVEWLVNPIVKSVTEGQGSIDAILAE